jgi:hypothetical protein
MSAAVAPRPQPAREPAVTSRTVAVELAVAAEHLQRAALVLAQLDPSYDEVVMAWTRDASDILDWSLEFHARHEVAG